MKLPLNLNRSVRSEEDFHIYNDPGLAKSTFDY